MVIVVQHADEHLLKHAGPFPFLKAPVARRAGAELARDRAPLTAGAEPIDDAAEHGTIVIARPSAVRFRWLGWQQQLQHLPERLGNRTESLVHAALPPHTRDQRLNSSPGFETGS